MRCGRGGVEDRRGGDLVEELGLMMQDVVEYD